MNLKEKKSALDWKKIFSSEEFERNYCYFENDLGYTYSREKTTFKVWSPTAEKVLLNLYTRGSKKEVGDEKINTYAMTEKNNVWEIDIFENLKDVYYTYTIFANGESNEVSDINGKASGVNGERSMVIDLEDTNPKGWEFDKNANINIEDRVIYELHIKDFSYLNENCREEYRGKYLAFTENDEKTGLNYIKSLGVTYIHLLPFFDFASIDETSCKDDFNWGYDPLNYNVPEGSYSTNAYDGKVRIKEVKEMIKAIHDRGMGVIMDVVYNHTFSTDSIFNRTVPYYYYRIDENGNFSNGSACGNETASENIMYRKFMIDSVLFWAREYHIDGFRFDLMGLHDVETINAIRSALDNEFGKGKILIYGEPWTGGKSSIREKSVPCLKENIYKLDENISVFCDTIRDLIKGSVFFEKDKGIVNGISNANEKFMTYLQNLWSNQKIDGFNINSFKQIINYVSVHDNLTLWDKLKFTNDKENDFLIYNENIVKQNKLAIGIVFTTCGIPLFQAGEEFARSKQGDENSYKSSPRINALDWSRKEKFSDLCNYYKELIAIRKKLPILCNSSNDYVKNVDIKNKDGLILVILEKSENCKQDYNKILIVYNLCNSNKVLYLDEKYEILFGSEKSNISKNIIVNGLEMYILTI